MFESSIAPELVIVLEKLKNSGIIEKYNFYLAGGTSLALQFGHRFSVDMDFFTAESFEPATILSQLNSKLDFTVVDVGAGTLHITIYDQKISFFYYPYKLLFPLLDYNGCPVADYRDVVAMKIIAIAQRGSKKDFVDLFHIMQKGIDLRQLKKLLNEKYSGQYSWPLLLKGIGYFEDAEIEPMPVMRKGDRQSLLTDKEWENIKAYMLEIQKAAIKEMEL